MVAERDFQRRIDGFRTGIGEEAVRDAVRRHADDAFGQRQCLVIGDLEAHAVVELGDLLLHGLDDLRVTMTDAAGPQSGKSVVKTRAVNPRVVVAPGSLDDARFFPEIAICRERHPESVRWCCCGAHTFLSASLYR